jgi:hypothetical protein
MGRNWPLLILDTCDAGLPPNAKKTLLTVAMGNVFLHRLVGVPNYEPDTL